MPNDNRFSSGPLQQTFAITASDATKYAPPLRGIFVGGAGNVTIINEEGNSVLFTAPAVGTVLPVIASKVMATGTTATALVGGY